MASKLGTLLVREGVITPQQLEEALRIQVVYGGRLGTNLVELGYVDSDTMADWLGRVSGFPVATRELLEAVPDDVVALLPPDMVERFECFPIRKDGKRLHLAMVTPNDLAATDALSFKTGLRIVPYVVPEMLLNHLQEARYGIKKKLGYVRLGAESKPAMRPVAHAAAPASVPPPPGYAPVASTLPPLPHAVPTPKPFTSPPIPAPTVAFRPPAPPMVPPTAPPVLAPVAPPPTPGSFAGWTTPAPATHPPAARPPAPPLRPGVAPHAPTAPAVMPVSQAPTPRPAASTLPELRPVSIPQPASVPPPPHPSPTMPPPVRPVAPATHPHASATAVTAPNLPRIAPPGPPSATPPPPAAPFLSAPVAPASAAAEPAPIPFEEAVAALAVAHSRDDIAEALLRYGRGAFDWVVLFLVRDGMALGWKGRGAGLDPTMVELIMLPLNAPSMFQEAADARAVFTGPVGETVLHRHFYKALRRELPHQAAVVPVVMKDRAVNLIYGDRADGADVSGAAQALSELAGHVAAAYERIVRESKRRLEGR